MKTSEVLVPQHSEEEASYVAAWYSGFFRLCPDSLPRLCSFKDVGRERGWGAVSFHPAKWEPRVREVEGSLFPTGHGGNDLNASGH